MPTGNGKQLQISMVENHKSMFVRYTITFYLNIYQKIEPKDRRLKCDGKKIIYFSMLADHGNGVWNNNVLIDFFFSSDRPKHIHHNTKIGEAVLIKRT